MKTVIGLFSDSVDALEAIYPLLNSGFARDHISFVMNDTTELFSQYERGVQTLYTHPIFSIANLLTKVCSQLIPGIGLVVSAGPMLDDAKVVTGHLLNVLKGRGIPEERAEAYTEGVRRGGSLLVVYAAEHNAVQAVKIINQNNPIDLERRIAVWRAEGWRHFNSHVAPLSVNDLEAERQRFQNHVGGIKA